MNHVLLQCQDRQQEHWTDEVLSQNERAFRQNVMMDTSTIAALEGANDAAYHIWGSHPGHPHGHTWTCEEMIRQ